MLAPAGWVPELAPPASTKLIQGLGLQPYYEPQSVTLKHASCERLQAELMTTVASQRSPKLATGSFFTPILDFIKENFSVWKAYCVRPLNQLPLILYFSL